jgi:hypothetical protein
VEHYYKAVELCDSLWWDSALSKSHAMFPLFLGCVVAQRVHPLRIVPALSTFCFGQPRYLASEYI